MATICAKNQTEQFVVASNALTYNPCAMLDCVTETHEQQQQLMELANNYTGASVGGKLCEQVVRKVATTLKV